jgi:hypothetical protein
VSLKNLNADVDHAVRDVPQIDASDLTLRAIYLNHRVLLAGMPDGGVIGQPMPQAKQSPSTGDFNTIGATMHFLHKLRGLGLLGIT